MCGRYTLIQDVDQLRERFHVRIEEEALRQLYNAAPSQNLPVITNAQPDTLQFLRWGLIPFWAKDAAIGNKLINARAETLAEKPSFKKSLQTKRCLIPADGFYEWKKEKSGKQPYRITLKNNAPFALAGLWDEWKNPDGKRISSFTIITTAPNALMQSIHDRMPVILPQAAEKTWLRDDLPVSDALELLTAYDADAMESYPVSTLVNSPANSGHELIEPLALTGKSGS